MDLGLTAEAIGTTTGRTTGMRVNSGRRACTMPTSKPTSLTCWPRPARSRSTEGTELPTGNVRMSSLGLAKDGLPPTNGTLRRPPATNPCCCWAELISQPIMRLKENFWLRCLHQSWPWEAAGSRPPSPNPALDKSFFSTFYEARSGSV